MNGCQLGAGEKGEHGKARRQAVRFLRASTTTRQTAAAQSVSVTTTRTLNFGIGISPSTILLEPSGVTVTGSSYLNGDTITVRAPASFAGQTFSVPRGYSDGFWSWAKQVAGLCLTAFLQTTLLFLGLLTFPSHMILGQLSNCPDSHHLEVRKAISPHKTPHTAARS